MLKSKSPKVKTSSDDDFLYVELTKLLQEMRLVQGGAALDASLRRHREILLYLMSKQIEKIRHVEEKYFNEDGSLNLDSIQAYHQKSTLQN